MRCRWLLPLVVWLAVAPPVAAQEVPVDLELILALDASGSVNQQEFALQLRGYAEAFRNPVVIQSITTGEFGAIAVLMLIWAGDRRDGIRVVADWTFVNGPESANAFVESFTKSPRYMLRDGTSISNVIELASKMFDANNFRAPRRLIDISGDGTNNVGYEPSIARDIAVKSGVTINGLAILTDFPDLDDYYAKNVVGGAGAFVVAAQNFEAFSAAILQKLVREISSRPQADPKRDYARVLPTR
ncbi:MAG: DUF1194 domain-containing protein [Alphaproteobacteria bacterium]|nr:DUF1194 domain-containing protein [Alphaproteobacteria bacterium]